MADYTYDVFISYSHKDEEWVWDWLLPQLEDAGLKVCIDDRDFLLGVPSIVNMERAVSESRHTLLVLTPNWVKSEWTDFESLLTQTSDPAGRRRRVIPLLLEEAELPPRLASLTYLDLTDRDKLDQQWPRLLRNLGVRQDEKTEPEDTQAPARSSTDLDWVTIPAGEFLMGSDQEQDPMASPDEIPQHTIQLPEYRITRAPVTNAQYKQFIDAVPGYDAPAHWKGGRIPEGKEDHPVISIAWSDARDYCVWAGGRLPTEAEWEKAARGTDGRIWPWGNERPTKLRCNFGGNVGDTTPVDKYPKGASPYGCLDMAGNVWEWTSSLYKDYPYKFDDGREDLEATAPRVLRGGSFERLDRYVRCASRLRVAPIRMGGYGGFRVVSPGF